jgi:tRNA(Ile)-lysidine synthase
LGNNYINLGAKWNNTIDLISEQYQGVVLGHSGGADSTALFHVLYEVTKRKKNFSLSLYHMNFGLRGKQSELDELFSRDLAARFGVPFHCDKITSEERELRNSESLQEWARRLRYQVFENWVKKKWLVALAHHQGDVAENVLIRLSRGSSVGSLAGMEPLKGGYWRPLLHTKKAALLQYLEKIGENHRVDASNDKIDYSRNLIRHNIIPELNSLYQGCEERIARTGIEGQEISNWCRSKLSDDLKHLNKEQTLTYLKTLPRGVCFEALGELINKDGVHRQLNRSLLGDIWQHIQSGSENIPMSVKIQRKTNLGIMNSKQP